MQKKKSKKLYELIIHLRPLVKHLSDAVELELEGTGVTVAMRAVMEQLSEHNSLTVPGLTEVLFLRRQTIQPLVDKLYELNLISRHTNPRHKRSYAYKLTENGKSLLNNIRSKENSNLEQISNEYSMEEIDTCITVLSKMEKHFINFKQWRNEL